MKRLMISMLAMAAMVSCSTEEVIDNAGNNGKEKVEITPSAGVSAITSKAPITAWANTPVNFAFGSATETYTGIWNAQIASDKKITFRNTGDDANEPKYYESNGTSTFLIGYHPKGTLTGNKVDFTIDGLKDIMATQELSGNKTTPIAGNFLFNHLLTQLKFKLVQGAGFPDDATVTKIEVVGSKTSASLDLTNPTDLDFTAGVVGNITVSDSFTEQAPTVAGVENGIVMVQPGVALKLNVTAGGIEYNNIEVIIDGDATAVKSKAYTITLTFSKKELDANGVIGEWTEGAGSGSIQ